MASERRGDRGLAVKRARVLLADDHTIVVQGLEILLREHVDLVGSVRDGVALVEEALRLRPDVVVVDISMPLLNGLDAIRELRRRESDARAVVLTMYAERQLAVEALQAGASAYVLKHSAGEELVTALREVLRGRTYITPLLAGEVRAPAAEMPARRPARSLGLTSRQRQVLQLVAEGRTMKEIAGALNLSSRTVESHKYQMLAALQLRTTADLVRYAVQLGLVSGDPAPPEARPPRRTAGA
jgi:DNA-binding NarL/FixJ family response regulator